jgi:formylglycine-generating enzyme required for sulfatase activity
MSKILISYRREDSADVTGRIYDRLIQVFPQSVFRDVDSIPLGLDFRTYLDEQVAKCDVFLAVIGRDWMKAKGRKGKSRLEDPGDFVRVEIESALKREIPVIPVLVQGAAIPKAERLPASIQDLSYRNGIAVRPDPDFHKDMDRLIAKLKQPVQGLAEFKIERGTPSKPASSKIRLVSPALPVDMVKVPKGPFLYGEEKTRETIDHDYWIDKYPVTNEKYEAFISAGGYKSQQYWSDEGWRWKMKENIQSPKYWGDTEWSNPDHPVVGVSYYKAEAYAKWAGKRLPTEQEWEKAARGKDGRQYPWGEEFDKNKCTSTESGIGHTTSVSQYPKGVSPYGCYDMAGNVWEWCSSWYDESQNWRVVRGGSWYDRPRLLRASDRGRDTTGFQDYTLGFRLVVDIP